MLFTRLFDIHAAAPVCEFLCMCDAQVLYGETPSGRASEKKLNEIIIKKKQK
jgi:hypothetical protein